MALPPDNLDFPDSSPFVIPHSNKSINRDNMPTNSRHPVRKPPLGTPKGKAFLKDGFGEEVLPPRGQNEHPRFKITQPHSPLPPAITPKSDNLLGGAKPIFYNS